jgi:hypothetical protein
MEDFLSCADGRGGICASSGARDCQSKKAESEKEQDSAASPLPSSRFRHF